MGVRDILGGCRGSGSGSLGLLLQPPALCCVESRASHAFWTPQKGRQEGVRCL